MTDSPAAGLLQLVRPKQWIKNGFVLAPLLFSVQFTDPLAVTHALLAVALFSLAASATYIVNDFRDIENDRRHPVKRHERPLAAGRVKPRQALRLLLCIGLLLSAAVLTWPTLGMVLLAYLGLSFSYSLWLKHRPVVDIFAIAGCFVLRVYGGAVAIDVSLSAWMFITTLCMALYLAAIKRRQELVSWGSDAREVLDHYSVQLVDRYATVAAVGALLFYSLYVLTEHPQMVITVPLVLFGLYRYWFLVESEAVGESPTDVLLSDRQLLLTTLALITCCAIILWRG